MATALAHRDDTEPRSVRRVTHARPSDGEGGIEGGAREVGELGRHVVDAELVREVTGGEAQQEAAVLHA